jgi:glycosyltransferase involved in cell wall biosynthesis
MKLSIVIPAYNEEKRIGRTLEQYAAFFDTLQQHNTMCYELVVVLNGCKDKTIDVVQQAQKNCSAVRIIDLKDAGKGLAVAAGFRDALKRDNDLIGFVDADGATAPQQFCELVEKIGASDGIIASRYMKASQIFPAYRPWYSEIGRRIIYHPVIRVLYRMPYADFQCGAKLFTRASLEKIESDLTVKQWGFDVELLYRCKQHGLSICEIPTVWHDQSDSKFNVRSGIRMVGALFTLRFKDPKKSSNRI